MTSLKYNLLVIVVSFLVENSFSYDANYRLSTNHIPESYNLEMLINPSSEVYNGTVTINFSTKNTSKTIRLHACPLFLTLKQIKVNEKNLCKVSHPTTILENTTEIVTITCEDFIRESDDNKITISYEGLFRPHARFHPFSNMGLKLSSYRIGNKGQSFVASQFEPIFARRAFPCFDEPQLKAVFNVTIIHPEHYQAISNTPAYSESVENGMMHSKFERTPIMSTYLLAIVVSKLEVSTEITARLNRESSVKNIYMVIEQRNHTRTLSTYGGILLDTLESWSGITYKELGMDQLNFAIIPLDYTGSIPSWGLICFHEFDVLDNGVNTTPELKQFIISNIVYEQTLQWFGDYVTPDWWSNVWLKEAFAGYFQYFIPDQVEYLQMDRQRQFITEYVQPALYSDSPYPFGAPLSSKEEDVYWQDHIAAKMWSVNYQKGACIIRMLEGIMGKELFKKGVQQYLTDNKYENTSPTILLKHLGRYHFNSEFTLAEIMGNWMYKPGYPLVTIVLNKDGKSVSIQQDEYNSKEKNQTTWYIPISYTTSSEMKFDVEIKHFLRRQPLNIKLENKSWIIVNLQQSGFYRVNYDKELWKRIIDVLKSQNMKHIHVSNRAQLIDDAFTLAKKGIISYNISLNLLEYIKKETEFEPWYTAKTWIKETIFLLYSRNDTTNLQKFKKAVLGFINEAFPKGINTTSHLQKLTKSVIIELKHVLGEPKSLQESESIFEKYNPEQSINGYINIKTALCYNLQMKTNSTILYNSLMVTYRKSKSILERREILSAIGCINDPRILKMYLMETISNNSHFSDNDVRTVYQSVYQYTNIGTEVYLKFLNEHLNEILNRYNFINIYELLSKAADRIVNEKQLAQLKEITRKYQSMETMQKIGQPLVEETRKQLNIQEGNIQDIVSFLSD